jgi:hypothetical protein
MTVLNAVELSPASVKRMVVAWVIGGQSRRSLRFAGQPRLPPGRESDAIALHPNAAERYKQKVADVHAALKKGDSASREAIALVRGLIERITITPTPRDKPPKLELIGNLAALMRESSENTVTVPMVAGACITRYRIYGGPPIQPMIKEYAGAALAAAAVSVAMAASAWADVKDYEFQLVRR